MADSNVSLYALKRFYFKRSYLRETMSLTGTAGPRGWRWRRRGLSSCGEPRVSSTATGGVCHSRKHRNGEHKVLFILACYSFFKYLSTLFKTSGVGESNTASLPLQNNNLCVLGLCRFVVWSVFVFLDCCSAMIYNQVLKKSGGGASVLFINTWIFYLSYMLTGQLRNY